jgi:hypothetical protein
MKSAYRVANRAFASSVRPFIAACFGLVAGSAVACATSVSAPAAAESPVTDAGATATPGALTDGSASADIVTPAFTPGSKSARCAREFGDALTAPFGRIDGTVVAIVTPADKACTLPNSDHVVVQVLMKGKVYRLVVNVLSTRNDPNVRFAIAKGPAMKAPAFEEGWHTDVSLDYATDLNKHPADFAPVSMEVLIKTVTDAIPLDGKISVYATSSGGAYAHSAHKVHRNGGGKDGALVLAPESATPTYLLFHFSEQSF